MTSRGFTAGACAAEIARSFRLRFLRKNRISSHPVSRGEVIVSD
jgi:hypothetical protein